MLGETQVRERGSRDRWLNAAYQLLILGGIEAVKIMPLAKRLNLTRTGFYWFFAVSYTHLTLPTILLV